ncbi:MAG: CoA transferase [Dehalococcoidia bacterium]|nr:CoA transferase [Dehalococcoidia bacterium]
MSGNGKHAADGSQGALTGIRVLDMSIFQNGPFAGVMLGDMGADVIKIEHPKEGDPARNVRLVAGTDGDDFKIYFETMNRNKRGMTLDLKHPQGQEVFHTLVQQADVVLQNWRLGVAQRLGADYDSLRKVNPRIIRAANTGFGALGPDADMPVFDQIGQARSGFTHVMADPDGTPSAVGTVGFADQMGAIIVAYSVTMALLARERFGMGQNIETSQLGAMMFLMQSGIHQSFMGNFQPRRLPRSKITNPLSTTYRGADGKWLSMGGVQGDRFWPELAKLLAIEELVEDPRYNSMEARAAHSEELVRIMDGSFKEKPRDVWVGLLRKAGIVVGPVQEFAELWTDPQCVANGYLAELEHPTRGTLREVGVPVTLGATPGRPRHVAPEFGQHTEEVLLEHGYTWEQIAALREAGAI